MRVLDQDEIEQVSGGRRFAPGFSIYGTSAYEAAFGGVYEGGASIEVGLSESGGGGSPDEYQSGVDYCGSDWINVPDTLYGVDISEACYRHDLNYSFDSKMDRYQADWSFALDIYNTLLRGGVSDSDATDMAMFYYGGVRYFGESSYEGSGSSE